MSTTGQAKDLAEGAGETVPLKPNENFEGRPHPPDRMVDLADVFGYGPSAPGWLEPARSRVLP